MAFVIPGMPAYGGGITSILRLGTYLAELGNEVSYISCSGETVEQMSANARINLSNFRGTLIRMSDLKNEKFDIGIATIWDTAYQICIKEEHFSYKTYFVQDYEPFFYAKGDLFHLSRATYALGFHMISLGQWNTFQIKDEFPDVKIDWIPFPVELGQYPLHRKKIRPSNRIKIAVYYKFEAKRASDLIIQSLLLLEKKLREKGLILECYFFGTDIEFGFSFIKTLGMLNHSRLRSLYQSCDFGYVASFTNVSLVPFEMTASGLPVIDFKDGSAPHFFKGEEMIFVDFYPRNLVDKVLYYHQNPSELEYMVARAQEQISSKTWRESSQRFFEIIQNAGD